VGVWVCVCVTSTPGKTERRLAKQNAGLVQTFFAIVSIFKI
jgi:hypothetical protein